MCARGRLPGTVFGSRGVSASRGRGRLGRTRWPPGHGRAGGAGPSAEPRSAPDVRSLLRVGEGAGKKARLEVQTVLHRGTGVSWTASSAQQRCVCSEERAISGTRRILKRGYRPGYQLPRGLYSWSSGPRSEGHSLPPGYSLWVLGPRSPAFHLFAESVRFHPFYYYSSSITSWQIDGETVETVIDYFGGLQNHCRQWLQPRN